jgi:hypothetical protein
MDLHRHTLEVISIGGKNFSGLRKEVVNANRSTPSTA